MKTLESFPVGIEHAWEKFLSEERQDGLDVYPEIFHDGILFPLQRMRETEKMIAMARTVKPSVVMEIGSDKGGSFYHWVKGLIPTKAIALEIRGIPFAEAFQKAFPDTRFFFGDDSSYDPVIVDAVWHFLNGDKIDCLFIDGDKHGFSKDVAAYLPMMRQGGMIFLHDVTEVLNAQETMERYAKKGYRTETI